MKKRIVIKIGSSSITKNGTLNMKVMHSIASQVSLLFKLGVEVVIVSSGAVACGRKILNTNRKMSSQVAAIYGQNLLLNTWSKVFEKYSVHVGQVLISESDLKSSSTPLVMGLKHGIQIINANDAVNDEEMKAFYLSSDNDKLSGYIAEFIGATMLILLTNVDGVLGSDGKVITKLERDSQLLFGKKSSVGTGGMSSKVNVGYDSTKKGIKTIIANANRKDVILQVVTGSNIGTTF
jgi:glutamate 5-kinase